MKKHIAMASMATLLLIAAGCQDDNAASNSDKPLKGTSEVVSDSEGTAKATSGKATAAKGSKEEQIPYITPTWSLTKQTATLLENESGKIEFVGATEQKNAATYTVVLRATGELANASLSHMDIDFMTSEGKTFNINYMDLASIRMEHGSKYLVFDSEEEIADSHIVRLDGNFYDLNDDKHDENEFSIDVKPSKKTWELEGTRFPITLNTKINDTRKNDLGTVKITSISSDDTSSNKITINGSIKLKEDAESTLYMSALQPDTPYYYLNTLNPDTADNFYRNVDTTFSKEIELDAPLQAGGAENVYFSILGEAFAYNARTGKEIKNPTITRMVQGQNGTDETDEDRPDGYVDASGKRVYNAILESKSTYDLGDEEEGRLVFQYPTGGYSHLSFNIGAAKEADASAPTYEMVVYGSDFTDEEGKEPQGTILAKKTVSKDTPLEKVDVDVSGQSNITIFTTTTGKESIFGESKPYLPVILSDVNLKK
ncbi:hypothetical protein CN918_31215 [Priestia megaterium]|nr:hypothetical protein CN918_31215 [Priestia megaterium]